MSVSLLYALSLIRYVNLIWLAEKLGQNVSPIYTDTAPLERGFGIWICVIFHLIGGSFLCVSTFMDKLAHL